MQQNQKPLTRMQARSFLDLKVLVVEDEILISEEICYGLRSMGCEIVGPCYSLGMATAVAETMEIDLGILDMRLGNEMSFAVADILKRREVPFLWASGHLFGNIELEEPILHKPFSNFELFQLMHSCVANSDASRSSHPSPADELQTVVGY